MNKQGYEHFIEHVPLGQESDELDFTWVDLLEFGNSMFNKDDMGSIIWVNNSVSFVQSIEYFGNYLIDIINEYYSLLPVSKKVNDVINNLKEQEDLIEIIKIKIKSLKLKWKCIEKMLNTPPLITHNKELTADEELIRDNVSPRIVIYDWTDFLHCSDIYLSDIWTEFIYWNKDIKTLASYNYIEDWEKRNWLIETVYFWRNKKRVYDFVSTLWADKWYENQCFIIWKWEDKKFLAWNSYWLWINKWKDNTGSVRVGMNVSEEIQKLLYWKSLENQILEIASWELTNEEKIDKLIDLFTDNFEKIKGLEWDDFLIDEIMEIFDKEMSNFKTANDFIAFIGKYPTLLTSFNTLKISEIASRKPSEFPSEDFLRSLKKTILKKVKLASFWDLIQVYRTSLIKRVWDRWDLTEESLWKKLAYFMVNLKKFDEFLQVRQVQGNSYKQEGDIYFKKCNDIITKYLENNYWKKRWDWDNFWFRDDLKNIMEVAKQKIGWHFIYDEFKRKYKELLLLWEIWDTIADKWPFIMSKWIDGILDYTNSVYTWITGYTMKELKDLSEKWEFINVLYTKNNRETVIRLIDKLKEEDDFYLEEFDLTTKLTFILAKYLKKRNENSEEKIKFVRDIPENEKLEIIRDNDVIQQDTMVHNWFYSSLVQLEDDKKISFRIGKPAPNYWEDLASLFI